MFFHRVLRGMIAASFFLNIVLPPSFVHAGEMIGLPPSGTMISLSPKFNPAIVMGLNIHADNPLRFDFIIDKGDTKLAGGEFNKEATRLIKYFLAALTVPTDQMWVNLSPYEKDRIIPEEFGRTEMGKDLLAQDYLLKQLSSTLISPNDKLGAEFWKRVYAQAQERFGTTDIPMDAFNKVWIVPEEAVIYEHEKGAFIVESHLKVMTEEDYLAAKMNTGNEASALEGMPAENTEAMSKASKEIIKEILIPEIEKEVNEGQVFANLRQIYHSMLLATWYKQALKESILGQEYVDQAKTNGIEVADKNINQKIYAQYLEAFQKGVYSVIKEDYDAATDEIIPRKYFSGGIPLGLATFRKDSSSTAAEATAKRMKDGAVVIWDGAKPDGEPFDRAMNSIWAQVKPIGIGTSGWRAKVPEKAAPGVNVPLLSDREVVTNIGGFLAFEEQAEGLEKGTPVALGCDLRSSSPRVSQAVAAAILENGNEVEWLGQVPSPVLALWGMTKGIPSLEVTASHNPDDENGIKPNRRRGELLKSDEKPMFAEVAKRRAVENEKDADSSRFRVEDQMFKESVNALSGAKDVRREAIQLYLDRFSVLKTPGNPLPLKGKKVIVYQHSSVGRDIIVTNLRNMGAEVIAPAEYRLPDGQFKAIDTENVTPADKQFFKKLAAEYPDAFAIVSVDGDADRPFVIDENGDFHRGDVLGIPTAQFLGADFVAIPDSSNDAVDVILGESGVDFERTEVGSPYVVQAMNDAIAAGKRKVVSWEVNGGFLTGSDIELPGGTLKALPTRDATLPILATLLTASAKGQKISDLFKGIERRFTGGGMKKDFPLAISSAILRTFSPVVNDDRKADFEKGKSVRQVEFLPDGSIKVRLFNKTVQTLNSGSPEAAEFVKIRELASEFYTPQEGFGRVTSIRYVTGVRIQVENNDVVQMRYSKNKPTEFRVYTNADTQARADQLADGVVLREGGVYDQMRADARFSDSAMKSNALNANTTNGGIDLDQALGNMRVQKSGRSVNFSLPDMMETVIIDKGIVPVIINVVPFDLNNMPNMLKSGFPGATELRHGLPMDDDEA